jgi:hypothetical protein
MLTHFLWLLLFLDIRGSKWDQRTRLIIFISSLTLIVQNGTNEQDL